MGKGWGKGALCFFIHRASSAPRKCLALLSRLSVGLPRRRSWIGRGPLSPLPSFEHPDRVLQPRAQNTPARTAFRHPPKKSVVALQWFALTSHSEGRQILPRRRCVKIGFAARVKLCSALSRLSPAFETESVSPIGTSHSWPLPPGIRAHESQSVPYHPTPGHFYGFCSGPPPPSALSPALVVASPNQYHHLHQAPPPSHFSRSSQKGLSKVQIGSHHSPSQSPPMSSRHSGIKSQLLPIPWPCFLSSRSSPSKTRPRHCQPVSGTQEALPPSRRFSLCSLQFQLLLILLIQPNCHLFQEVFPDCTMLPSLLFTSSCLIMSWYRSQPVIILV